MLIFLAVIVVNMHARHQLAHGRKCFFDALLFWIIRQMGVADVEIEAQATQPRFIVKGAQIGGIAHLAGGVFDADGHADMLGMEDEMLEGAERGVALAGVVGLARAAHVKNHSMEREILGDIDGALQFVHGLDAADALDFADGKGLAWAHARR